MTTARRRMQRIVMLALVAMLVAGFAAVFPHAALAAPPGPTLTLSELQAKLDASPNGRVPGYFRTVLKGAKIDTIPVDVVAITVVGNNDFYGQPPRLVMFEATGTAIDAIGGIASGMSGSPVYVDDGGTDKLVGAVSYGDWFTLHNTGLATPIEYMSAIESVYPLAPLTLALPKPVRVEDTTVSRVLVAPDLGAARKAVREAGTLVAAPLTSLQLGGIPASSPLFKAWQAYLGKHGMNLLATPMGGGYDASFETTLTGGASIAALGSRGDFWYGAAGTVTYVNGDNILAFGHPLFWSGPSGLLLTNAWVDGIWPSSISPYKLISPTKPRGTLTQDRTAGIFGRLDAVPEEVPVTSRARMVDEGTSADSTSFIPRWVADSGDWMFIGIPANAALVAPYRAEDAAMVPGSAYATATIVVSDGSRTYTYTRSDLYDSSYDIGSTAGYSLFDPIYQMQSLNSSDIKKARLVSVDFDTSMSRTRRSGTVVDMTVPGGLKTGLNTVRTTLRLRDGSRQTVLSSLVIPKGVVLEGMLEVGAPGWVGMGYGYSSMDYMFYMGEPSESDQTLADVLSALQSQPKNTDLQVVYHPYGRLPVGVKSVATTSATDSYLRGLVMKSTPQIRVVPSTDWVGYGGSVRLRGYIFGASGDTTVTIMRKLPGATAETTVTRVPTSQDNPGFFDVTLRGLTTNATYIVRFDGDAQALPAQASVYIRTTARVTLGASPSRAPFGTTVRLSAGVTPTQPSGSVAFEVLSGGYWRSVKTVALTSGRTASFAWRPPSRGTFKVRARFLGSALNVTGTSGPVSVFIY